MFEKNYSAGMVKLPFWFSEFKKMIQLLNSGLSFEDIKELSEKENIFQAPSESRAKQIIITVSTRVKALDPKFYPVFENCDIANQKLIAVIAVMQSDDLFFDFMYEVFREKLIVGLDKLADSDLSIFFKAKQEQSERVAKWQDYTLKRLGSIYKTILMEGNLLEREGGSIKKIIRPLLDPALEECLKECQMDADLRILRGVS